MRTKADTTLHADRLILSNPVSTDNKIRLIVTTPSGRLPAFAHWAEGKTEEQHKEDHITIPAPGFAPTNTLAVDLVGVVNPYTRAIMASLDSSIYAFNSTGAQQAVSFTVGMHCDSEGAHPLTRIPTGGGILETEATTLVSHFPIPYLFRPFNSDTYLKSSRPHTSVYNLWIHPDDTYHWLGAVNISSEPAETHYIFHRATTPCRHQFNLEEMVPDVPIGYGMLLLRCMAMAMANDIANGKQVTLVEVDNIPRNWFSHPAGGPETSITTCVLIYLLDRNGTSWNSGDVNSYRASVKQQVTFRTLEEYRESFGSYTLDDTVAEIIKGGRL
jgi:hypothetical protein